MRISATGFIFFLLRILPHIRTWLTPSQYRGLIRVLFAYVDSIQATDPILITLNGLLCAQNSCGFLCEKHADFGTIPACFGHRNPSCEQGLRVHAAIFCKMKSAINPQIFTCGFYLVDILRKTPSESDLCERSLKLKKKCNKQPQFPNTFATYDMDVAELKALHKCLLSSF